MIDSMSRRELLALSAGLALVPGLNRIGAAQAAHDRGSRKIVRTRPLVEAHRGNSTLFPENTIPAVLSAVEIGADRVEVDVNVTKDGHAVLLHDDTVDRTTNGKGAIQSLNLSEVRKLDAGSWMDSKFAGVKVPTLRECLEAVKGKAMLDLDLKSSAAVPAMVADIKDAKMVDQVVISGLIPDCAEAIRALEPAMTMLSEAGDPKSAVRIAKQNRVAGLNYDFAKITPELIREAHLQCLWVNVWTVDKDEDIVRMIEWGADAIMSNDPKKVLDLIHSQQLSLKG